MPLHATSDRGAVYVICNGCDKTMRFVPRTADYDILTQLTGWYIGRNRTVWCPSCALLSPTNDLTQLTAFMGLASDRRTHAYSGNGPPGMCRLCGQLIGADEPWLEHSPNYPHVPPAFQRFPAHKTCWLHVLDQFTLNGASEKTEYYRVGW